MNKYELLLISPPDISEKAWHDELGEIREMLKKSAGGVFFEDLWGMKSFAYNIKKFDRGYYAVLYFNAEPEQILEVRTNIRLNAHVLRHLLLILPEGFEVKKNEDFFGVESVPVVEEKQSRFRKPTVQVQRPLAREMAPAAEKKEEKKPVLAGEAQLKSVEETLSKILDNPDIELK